MSDNGKQPGLVRAFLTAGLEERLLRTEEARSARMRVQASNRWLTEAARLVQPETDGFRPLASTARALDSTTAHTLREQARKAAIQSPHLRGYLRSLSRFVMGKGPIIRASTGDEKLDGQLDAWWLKWAAFNNWDRLEDEIPMRTWRDGESFLWAVMADESLNLLPSDAATIALVRSGIDVSALAPVEIPDGMMLLRLVPPEDISNPMITEDLSHGIITAADDVQTVLGYMHAPSRKLKRVISVSEMRHIPIGVDSDTKRGRSLLEPLLRIDAMYREWLDYRMALNYVRTAYAIVKKLPGATPTQAAAIRDQQTVTKTGLGNDRLSKRLKPGSTIVTNAEIEFMGPNLQAQDAQHDGRTLLLSMAAETGLPEYMFTGDSSNSNFASTLISESPALREFESWQDFFRPTFEWIWRKAMQGAIEAGAISGPSDIEDLHVSITYPNMLSREELEHAQANLIRFDAEILSKEGWARDEGIDWDTERDRIDREREEAIDFMAPE
ncbi:hypothetical protein LCGC14_1926710 [marine sediment metagenome]|uniref:Phage portal protein n=1 Tax=marine sediment metagenome TaxID=412755 RepID=A0A0F9FPS3_9ZZZZ